MSRPRDHFYGAVGRHVHVRLAASKSAVRVEEELTLTLHVIDAQNAARLQRPDLRQLDDYATAFHIDDLDDGPEQPVAHRYFRYRLRPKHERVTEIPAVLYRYYDPKLQYFATTVSDSNIPLTVQPKEPSSQTELSLDAPEFLFRIADDNQWEQHARPRAVWPWIIAVWIVPFVVCACWFAWWRWRNPDAARLTRLRRHRAVREALDALVESRRADDIAAALRSYLQHRFGLASRAQTTKEILKALTGAGVAMAIQAQAEEFFNACDVARFAPPDSPHADIRGVGRRLILLIEEMP